MNNENFKIFEDSFNDSIVVNDYISCQRAIKSKSNTGLYGVALASVIICSTNTVQAKNYQDKIIFEINQNSIDSVIEQNDAFDIYVNKLSNLSKLNFSKANIIEQIVSFKSLNENWDGYGAVPLEIKSASNAINIINLFNDLLIRKITEVYPNPHGTVSVEFENNFDEKLLLEIGNNNFTYFLKLNSMDVQFFNNLELIDGNIETLKKNIQSI